LGMGRAARARYPEGWMHRARASSARRRAHRAPSGGRRALEAFLGAVAEAGDGARLPQFVEREFREFLLCGVYEAGVARFQCEGCGREHLVPFSCKGRGFCPSCGGRRMTERAAHLVDEVLPWVPVRQWVLTLPYRLRY
jgi:Transposase zinc-binding domain